MTERKYSVSEIDRMRVALANIENSNSYWPSPYDGDSGALCWFPGIDYAAQSARIEDQLRTYLIGGVSPEELGEKAEKAEAACKSRIEECERQRVELRLLKEYGPRS